MTHTVRLAPAALQELDGATVWYEERRRGLGIDFLEAVELAARGLSRWPEAGSPIAPAGEHRFRRAPVAGFPYHLAYRVVGDIVEVLAVGTTTADPNTGPRELRIPEGQPPALAVLSLGQ